MTFFFSSSGWKSFLKPAAFPQFRYEPVVVLMQATDQLHMTNPYSSMMKATGGSFRLSKIILREAEL